MKLRSSLLALGAALVAGLAVVSGGCGGGGGGGPTEPQPGIRFSAAGTAGNDSLSLQQNTSAGSATTLVLELRAREVTDLYGIAFDLVFPSTVLAFEGFREGTLLDAGGTGTSLQVVTSGANRLVVGLTRLGAVSGASGSGLLLELRFTARASGSGSVAFERQQAWNGAGGPQGATWLAGSVSVTR
jgi:hypothetical protein